MHYSNYAAPSPSHSQYRVAAQHSGSFHTVEMSPAGMRSPNYAMPVMSDEARTPVFGGDHVDRRGTSRPPGPQHPHQGCQDNQCAEEGCDPEECGDENQPPATTRSSLVYGFDTRPFLPIGLIGSTVASGFTVMSVHIPQLGSLTGDEWAPGLFFVSLYGVCLFCMAYTACCDPGQVDPNKVQYQDGKVSRPKRAYKAWLYRFPVRRYDHYCRWLMNVIGLYNHRAFFTMCLSLMATVLCGGLADIVLMFYTASQNEWRYFVIVCLHLAYCCTVFGFLGNICWLHIGFVSRNETAHEWKLNLYQVAFSRRMNKTVYVNDLSDDEFNELFDEFEYDSSRNPWDQGWQKNCLTFWTTSRNEKTADEAIAMGEF